MVFFAITATKGIQKSPHLPRIEGNHLTILDHNKLFPALSGLEFIVTNQWPGPLSPQPGPPPPNVLLGGSSPLPPD